ncbi:hypothetical protein N7468_000199 [Penicillium chermesinum]|uniref:Uncharacterized protein n=1 Tax=Penicillium chermesinum TaxID=63820 RepID=A0A9W9TY47_9EURO|nr:uncharacterized protein N7468_000199 [Penicillium chermesinum]KAJ5248748.1 hypothetical protein N7468_000199 [Penicillium chermesinum]
MSRPSRTQQLQNPRLVPKLSEETPNPLLESAPVLDLVLAVRKLTKETSAGIADSILAKRDEERGRKTDLDGSFKRGRSISSHSDNSIGVEDVTAAVLYHHVHRSPGSADTATQPTATQAHHMPQRTDNARDQGQTKETSDVAVERIVPMSEGGT